MVSHAIVFLHGKRILSRRDAQVLEPFGINVEPPRAVLHDSTVPILSLSAQEPVDEYLRRVDVGRILNHTENAEGIACRQAFFRYRRGFDRQTGFDKRLGLTAAQAESQR